MYSKLKILRWTDEWKDKWAKGDYITAYLHYQGGRAGDEFTLTHTQQISESQWDSNHALKKEDKEEEGEGEEGEGRRRGGGGGEGEGEEGEGGGGGGRGGKKVSSSEFSINIFFNIILTIWNFYKPGF